MDYVALLSAYSSSLVRSLDVQERFKDTDDQSNLICLEVQSHAEIWEDD